MKFVAITYINWKNKSEALILGDDAKSIKTNSDQTWFFVEMNNDERFLIPRERIITDKYKEL